MLPAFVRFWARLLAACLGVGGLVVVARSTVIPAVGRALQWVDGLSDTVAAAVAVGALAVAVALLAVGGRRARAVRTWSLPERALAEAGLAGAGVCVRLSPRTVSAIVARATFCVEGVLGCVPEVSLRRDRWWVDLDLEVRPSTDIPALAARVRERVCRDLASQTHVEPAQVRVRAGFEPVSSQRVR